jgi:flagellar biosynthesis/type III secretory pathway M-ring protein FliF/YscJ
LIALGAGFVVVLKRSRRKRAFAKVEAETDQAKAIEAPDVSAQLEATLANQAALREKQAQEVMNSLKLPPVKTQKAEVLIKHINSEAKKDPTAMAQVVRTWLNSSDYQR